MRSLRDILRDKPVIGAYIKFEDKFLKRFSELREHIEHAREERIENARRLAKERKNKPSFLKRLPVIGAVFRFPGRVRKGIEDIPLVGTFGAKPLFALIGLATWPIRRITKLAIGGIVVPFALLGAVSFAFVNNPDWASDPIDDYLQKQGYDAAILEGVEHKDIRVYRDNALTFTFHAAGNMTGLNKEIVTEVNDSLMGLFGVVASYPMNFVTSLGMSFVKYNAFAVPAYHDDGTCFVVSLSDSVDSKRMISVLSGIPEHHLALDKEKLDEWVPLMVLGHEARHCDNGRDRYPAIVGLYKLRNEYQDAYLEELDKAVFEQGAEAGISDLDAMLEDNERLKALQKQIVIKTREVGRQTLTGETDSDIHSVPRLREVFPDSNVDKVMTYARAVSPFAGNLRLGTESHSTASGLDAFIQGEDTPASNDVWEAIYLGKMLMRYAHFMNSDEPIVSHHDYTLENYHIAKQVVMPYLEQRRDESFLRGDRSVSYGLVLDQLRLFVEGVEYMVKPESLAKSEFSKETDIPPLPASPSIAPVPELLPQF